ncbi:MAG TPA: TetR/AcrR family transcriptional regulator [Candidatus Acidoferrum sp.]|jgi:AcrR family transcriptional regulator
MSKNERSKPVKRDGESRQKPDQRILRTRNRLGNALIALILEKPIDKVTVQQVLNRAGVGRSTFYLHFRDKDDLFLSQLEDGLEMWTTALSKNQEKSRRVAPVREFFAHVADARKLYDSLVDSGRIQAFFDLAQGYFARGIARRLKEISSANPGQHELDACSHGLAGNLLSLLKWWMDRGAKESPQAIDEVFHRMVWKGMR